MLGTRASSNPFEEVRAVCVEYEKLREHTGMKNCGSGSRLFGQGWSTERAFGRLQRRGKLKGLKVSPFSQGFSRTRQNSN